MMVAVLPTNDTVHHDSMDEDCVCGPTVQPVERDDGSYGWVLVHHALRGDLNHPAPWEQMDCLPNGDPKHDELWLFISVCLLPLLAVALVAALVWWLR